ncbi:MAG: hypothetical protein ACTTKL_07740 [Treponema sp.]
MSLGLRAAKALVDAAAGYDPSVLNDKDALTDKTVKAVNSVLSDATKYENDGTHLKSWVKDYVEKKNRMYKNRFLRQFLLFLYGRNSQNIWRRN